jgi:hypothetical protein
MIVPICTASHRMLDRENINEGLQYMMMEAGMNPAEFKGTGLEVREAVQKAKRARARRLGLDHYEKFTDGQLTDSWATGYFPNVQIGMHPEGVFIMRFQPHPTDPERFYYDNMTLVRPVDDPAYFVPGWMGLPKDTDVSGNTRPNIENYAAGVRADLGDVLNQDVDLVEAVQRGQRSRGFKGPLWGQQEQRIRHYHRELDRYIREDLASKPAQGDGLAHVGRHVRDDASRMTCALRGRPRSRVVRAVTRLRVQSVEWLVKQQQPAWQRQCSRRASRNCPYETCRAFRSFRPCNPACLNASRARSFVARRGSSSPMLSVRPTARSPRACTRWRQVAATGDTRPTGVSLAHRAPGASAVLDPPPSAGHRSPYSSANGVDLPDPFGPVMHRCSPSLIVQSNAEIDR